MCLVVFNFLNFYSNNPLILNYLLFWVPWAALCSGFFQSTFFWELSKEITYFYSQVWWLCFSFDNKDHHSRCFDALCRRFMSKTWTKIIHSYWISDLQVWLLIWNLYVRCGKIVSHNRYCNTYIHIISNIVYFVLYYKTYISIYRKIRYEFQNVMDSECNDLKIKRLSKIHQWVCNQWSYVGTQDICVYEREGEKDV